VHSSVCRHFKRKKSHHLESQWQKTKPCNFIENCKTDDLAEEERQQEKRTA
jgi:hypothetical protein